MRLLQKLPALAVLVAGLAACGQGQAAEAEAPDGKGLDGKALFQSRCGMCHQTIGMAVGILARRPNDPSKGFLEDRTDLSATLVRTVVRTGIANMPRMPRPEVNDAELAAIASYLSRGKP